MYYVSYYKRSKSMKKKIDMLTKVLPYPLHFYETKKDDEINGMYRSHQQKMVQLAFERDEIAVRKRCGLI